MRSSLSRAMLLGPLLVVAAGSAMAAVPKVGATIVADTSAIQPGKPLTVAITVTPPAGWHIYWKNPGDAGLPTEVKWTLPAGFTAEPLEYPIPEKFTQAGDITDYGYRGPTAFLVKITPPAEASESSPVSLSAHVSWLCCKENCVPGGATVSLSLPVSGEGSPANVELFNNARAQLPANEAPADVVSQSVASQKAAQGVGGAGGAGQVVMLHLNWKQPVHGVDLYPTAAPSLDLSDISVKNTGNSSTISLTARVMQGQKLQTEDLPVLIVYSNSKNQRHGFYTMLDLHTLSAADAR